MRPRPNPRGVHLGYSRDRRVIELELLIRRRLKEYLSLAAPTRAQFYARNLVTEMRLQGSLPCTGCPTSSMVSSSES